MCLVIAILIKKDLVVVGGGKLLDLYGGSNDGVVSVLIFVD